MKRDNDTITYSPSDLVRFMESPFASWMQRLHLENPEAATPDEPSEEEALIARTGDEHEAAFLAHLKSEGRDVCEISASHSAAAFDQTRDAIAAGHAVIFQGALAHGEFAGFTDFLVRDDDGPYEIWDTKLARKTKPYHLVQLCCYAEMLGQLTGHRPPIVRVVLGNDDIVPYRTDEFFHYYLQLKDAFLAQMAEFTAGGEAPFPDPRADHRQWTSAADHWLDERDHLVRVAGISVGQIAKLEGVGVTTLAGLASCKLDRIPKLKDEIFQRLVAQAKIQDQSRQQPEGSPPLFEVIVPSADDPHRGLALLPPAAANDIFFDIEGYPLLGDGLEYLLGVTHLVDGSPEFVDWWAHDEDEEKAAFEDFIDWVHARWKADRSMHIYHYAPYEVTAVRRLMGKYATREEQVDDLLRNDVFLDLYRVVRQGVLAGAESYSLKEIEKLYREKREGDVQTALGSVVYYSQWLESGQPQEWEQSEILRKIRDYNEEDCVSTWELTAWLRGHQASRGIAFSPPADPADRAGDDDSSNLPEGVVRRMELAERLLAGLPESKERSSRPDAEQEHMALTELLGHLVEFHRRESKPVFWAKYERSEMTEEELFEDINCLAGLERTSDAPEKIKRSLLFRYSFDADQDTKIAEGKNVFLAENLTVKPTVHELDRDQGTIALKISKAQLNAKLDADELPSRLSLIPDEFVSPGPIEDAIERRVSEWANAKKITPLLRRLLTRAAPVVAGHPEGDPLVRDGEAGLDAARRVVPLLEDSALVIQGPPGCGKTFTGSHLIADLLADGKNVGIVSNSHKAVINLLEETNGCMGGALAGLYKPKKGETEVFEAIPGLMQARNASDYAGGLIAGTAWLFSHEDLEGRLDYLFVDEAGQVALANLVGMAGCTRNIILLGDQMQLAQPIQGSHPGETGSSALGYLLGDHATVPVDRGIFLDTSYRMHPGVCDFISDTVYEGRLRAAEKNERQILTPPDDATLLAKDSGLLFHPVPHLGNTQASDEEADAIVQLTGELLRCEFTRKDGKTRPLSIADILYVAPYNMQVRHLERRLPEGAKVGSVDRFQGQQAPVVILSLCSSAGEFGARGLGFILDQNRLNVAISRAQSLAIVVADPHIAHTPASNVDDMRRVSLFCRIADIDGKTVHYETARRSTNALTTVD